MGHLRLITRGHSDLFSRWELLTIHRLTILQVESIVKRPVIIDDMIAVRNMVNLCLSIDHRVLDGLVCGKFLARIKEIIETAFQEGASIY